MPDSLLDLGAKLTQLKNAFDGTTLRSTVTRVATQGKADALEAVEGDLPGRKFHHWRPKIGARYDLTSDSSATVSGSPVGPFKVLDVGRKRGKKFSRKRKRVIGWGPTKGRNTWDKAAIKITAETPGRFDKEVVKVIERLF